MSMRVVGIKRSREAADEHGPSTMAVDDDAALRDDSGADADREDADDDASPRDGRVEPPRRKRAMMIKANIRFLQKLPPLANYQRGQFGRRGGVDGGTPDGDFGMLALEETMSDSGFAVRVAARTAAAAAVAPAPTGGAAVAPQHRHPTQLLLNHHQHYRQQHQQQQFLIQQQQQQQQRDGWCPQVHSSRRNASLAFSSRPPEPQATLPFYHRSGPVATANTKKDDEPRPATSGTRLW
ncbi:hypothetical protein PybrP1_011195 [[Pythium] brassicae (nom. inval.)]|nr:hypothetical protein PybrP1_011195 [[Pythium] brassicae (nom. inval.)]